MGAVSAGVVSLLGTAMLLGGVAVGSNGSIVASWGAGLWGGAFVMLTGALGIGGGLKKSRVQSPHLLSPQAD